MKTFAIGAAVVLGAVGSASADVTFNLTNFTATGFQFFTAAAPGTLTGTLTGVSINATLTASTNFTYADDLTVYVANVPLATGGALQVGGFSNLGAAQKILWANGGSELPGTVVNDTQAVNPINIGASSFAIYLGNGYGAAGTSGTWTGTVTLIGVDIIPAPGAVALLGMGGLVALRRRR